MEKMIDVNVLKPHPRNKEFFDDITGDNWEKFKQSIVRRGVLDPIVITEDLNEKGTYIIISGHQRVRACKDESIRITEIPYRLVTYSDCDEFTGTCREDMMLEDLISTNIKQRGVGNLNEMKMCKCIKELERIYGIKQGGNGSNQYLKVLNPNNSVLATQEDLAKELGISQDTLTNYKKLNNLIPELQSLVENKAMKATVGYKIWAKMPQEEQEKFFNEIGRDKIKKLTQKETERIVNEKRALEETNKALEESYNELSQKYNEELNNKKEIKEKVVEKIVEVDKTDYETIKQLRKEVEYMNSKYKVAQDRVDIFKQQAEIYEKDSKDYKDLTRQIELLTKEKDDIGRSVKSATELSGYIYDIEDFLKTKLAPINYSRALIDCKDNPVVIDNVRDIVECVEKWCVEMRKYLPTEQQKNIINVEVI